MNSKILLALLCAAATFAETPSATVPYPADYRQWTHIKSTIVGPRDPGFAVNGGLHHFYANHKAMEGYKTGKFPDGSVLIDDLLEIKENAGIGSEGTRRRVAVMHKDSAKFRDSGGWGFEVFKADDSSPALNAEAKASCFACHSKRKDTDLTFTKFRK